MHSIYPRSHYCKTQDCERSQRIALKKAESRQCVLFTMNGPIPVWSVHLYCESECISIQVSWTSVCSLLLISECKINYHSNFWVKDGERTYYQENPDVLQVGEHQFFEIRVINMWTSMMLLAWSSATNCARIYNTAFTATNCPEWQFKLAVTSRQVYDAFELLSLLEDCKIRQEPLIVPHDGTLKDRFSALIHARNSRFRLCSQPELFHYCAKCTRFFDSSMCAFYMQEVY